MTEPTPVYLQLTMALEPGEEVHAEPAGHEWHIVATLGKARRLVGRVVPIEHEDRAWRQGGYRGHCPSLVAEMAAAEHGRQNRS
jgi:hypothetical protein